MLKYARGKYQRTEAHMIIDVEEVRYFHVKTGHFLGSLPKSSVPATIFAKSVDCVMYSLLFDTVSKRGDFAGFNGKGKIMEVPNITQQELDALVKRLKLQGFLCQFQHFVTEQVIEYVYIVRGDRVV